MRRISFLLTATALIAAAGCSDSSSPSAPSSGSESTILMSRSSGSSLGGAQYSFDISPNGGVYWLGGYMLSVPAHGVCDPSTSGYGSQYWDSPCNAASGTIHITASIQTINGRDYVDFSPHIRFVPSNNQSQWATISTVHLAAIGGHGDLRRFSILFSTTPGGTLIDESATDPTLATHINIFTGWEWRRIKHFTGYDSTQGIIDDCTPGVDDGCYAIGTVIVDGGP